MRCNFRQCREWSKSQSTIRHIDAAQLLHLPDIDESRRGDDAVLHQIKQVDAACLGDGVALQLIERFRNSGAVNEREAVHACISLLALPKASSTFAGVIGMRRLRTPVA